MANPVNKTMLSAVPAPFNGPAHSDSPLPGSRYALTG